MKRPGYLLVDLGNTCLKWATAPARGPLRPRGDTATAKLNASSITSLARKFPHEKLVLASVVPKWIPTFRGSFKGRIEVVEGSTVPGLLFDYPRPAELGADRIAAAVAIHESGKFPAIIVACGTATAFTVLDAKGRLCGGAIAPGPQAQLAALVGTTAQLPETTLRRLPRLPAKSTREAISAGVLLQFQGGVKESIAGLSASLASKPHIILTGGNAVHLADAKIAAEVRPLLVMEGLLIIGRRRFTPHNE